jgi:hypothetical protein
MSISQEDYLKDLTNRFGMANCNPAITPMEPGIKYTRGEKQTQEETFFMQDKPYRAAACSLMYASTITRPDITFACNTASRYLQEPKKVHWELVKRTLRYIKGTAHLHLCFSAQRTNVTGWPDASWADNLDDRKSTGAFIFFIGTCAISWSSKKQGYVALSTNNAELGALSEASREAFYIRGLLNDIIPNFLPDSQPIQIFEDNEGAILQANNNILNHASRTIALKFHFIKEEISAKRIILSPIPSQEQLGDLLTKALPAPAFNKLRDLTMGMQKWTYHTTTKDATESGGGPKTTSHQKPESEPAIGVSDRSIMQTAQKSMNLLPYSHLKPSAMGYADKSVYAAHPFPSTKANNTQKLTTKGELKPKSTTSDASITMPTAQPPSSYH